MSQLVIFPAYSSSEGTAKHPHRHCCATESCCPAQSVTQATAAVSLASTDMQTGRSESALRTFLESIFSTGRTGLGPVSGATACTLSGCSSAPHKSALSAQLLAGHACNGMAAAQFVSCPSLVWSADVSLSESPGPWYIAILPCCHAPQPQRIDVTEPL